MESEKGRVYVLEVTKDGAAEAAGIKKGDVITKVNGFTVTNGPEMVGQIATLRPGEFPLRMYVKEKKSIST
jgi:S1-C subfamily serine protease